MMGSKKDERIIRLVSEIEVILKSNLEKKNVYLIESLILLSSELAGKGKYKVHIDHLYKSFDKKFDNTN